MGLDRPRGRVLLDKVRENVEDALRRTELIGPATRHFGLTDSEHKTINSVLGYMPSIPHWGWNGNARRYWDFM